MKTRLSIFTLLVVFSLSLLSFTSCFPGGCIVPGASYSIDIIIENQSGQVLYFDYKTGITGTPFGNIAPGGQIVIQRGMDSGRYQITASNTQGEIVFSETYTYNPEDKYHLIETDIKHKGVPKVYKAIIPHLTNISGK